MGNETPMLIDSKPRQQVLLHPNAKVNLGLLIKGRQPDGYHLLETVYLPVPDLYDVLTLAPLPQGELQLEVRGKPLEGEPESNLCAKAYRALQAVVPDLPGVFISLEKNIPAGAGLGGGSSDAAATLLGLNELFSLGFSQGRLAELAAPLGADVPFFVYNRPLLATGIGTDFEEIHLDLPFQLKLVTPQVHSSTVAAYRKLDYRQFDPDRSLKAILNQPVSQWREQLVNDLEVPVFQLHPELAHLKAELYAQGAVYAAMSGSGSAFFGLFASQ